MPPTPVTRGRKHGTYRTAVAAVLRLATSGRAVPILAIAGWAGKPSRSTAAVSPRYLSPAASCCSDLASSAWLAFCVASGTSDSRRTGRDLSAPASIQSSPLPINCAEQCRLDNSNRESIAVDSHSRGLGLRIGRHPEVRLPCPIGCGPLREDRYSLPARPGAVRRID